MKTSAFFIESFKEFKFLFVAKAFFSLLKFFLSDLITPLLSSITIFFFFAPNAIYNFEHDMAAAPAPETTILTLSISLFAICKALISAAHEIIAVPC